MDSGQPEPFKRLYRGVRSGMIESSTPGSLSFFRALIAGLAYVATLSAGYLLTADGRAPARLQ